MVKLVTGLILGFYLVSPANSAETVMTPYGESSIEFTVHKVADAPVYYVIGQSGVPGAENQGMTSNAGFVVTKKGVRQYWVIDYCRQFRR